MKEREKTARTSSKIFYKIVAFIIVLGCIILSGTEEY
jgi:hypothetical protein